MGEAGTGEGRGQDEEMIGIAAEREREILVSSQIGSKPMMTSRDWLLQRITRMGYATEVTGRRGSGQKGEKRVTEERGGEKVKNRDKTVRGVNGETRGG